MSLNPNLVHWKKGGGGLLGKPIVGRHTTSKPFVVPRLVSLGVRNNRGKLTSCCLDRETCLSSDCSSIILPEVETTCSIEAAAIRAIKQAELEYREAAKKLLQAQAKLQSAKLVADELRNSKEYITKSVDNPGSENSYVESLEEQLTEESNWRESVNVVEAVFEAEEKRKEGLESFRMAAETLRQRLLDEPVQTSINDFHIELLDNGGQYHVAQWLINEVEESGSTQLVMNINLDLALQGCDPHVVQFLHNLPYGQVLGIKTSVKSGQSVVDFSDGSSWESEFCDRALHGEDGDLFFIWESSKVKPKADHRMVNWKLEQLQAPAIDVDVLEDRPLPETSNFLTESSSIPTDKAPYSLLPIVKPKLLPPVLWRPFPDFLGSKEMAICIASFSYVLMVMVKSCELATLVVDACMIGFVGSFVVAAACFVGAVSPPLPKILREKWPQTETKARTWKSLSISNKPWEQVVFWMAAASAVLSSATVSAIFVKSVQLGVSSLSFKLSSVAPASLVAFLPDTTRLTLFCLGLAGGNSLLSESLPYIVSSFMWLLLLLSVVVASASVSLILVGCTGRVQES